MTPRRAADPDPSRRSEEERRPSRFRRGIGLAILAVLVLSIIARALWPSAEDRVDSGEPPPAARTTRPGQPETTFLPGAPGSPREAPEPASPPAEESPVREALPVVTEASFFALVGFALGYFTRKVVKLAIFVLGGLFLVLQGLSYVDVVQIDWDRALALVNDLVLNIKGDQRWEDLIKNRIPSLGAFGGGLLLGFRRG